MNAGEYVGKDGRTYRWVKHGSWWDLEMRLPGETEPPDEEHEYGWATRMHDDDWPAAKAALDALIAEQNVAAPPEFNVKAQFAELKEQLATATAGLGGEASPWKPWFDTLAAHLDEGERLWDEQVEQDAGEWMYLHDPDDNEAARIRVSPNGETVQEFSNGKWQSYDAWWIRAAYRAGLAQDQKVRDEAVRELVEAVRYFRVTRFGDALSVEVGDVERLQAAAAKVKL